MGTMSIKRTAIWLFAAASLILLGQPALAQPANSNLQYQGSTPSWENGSAPFSNDNPHQDRNFLPFHPINVEPTMDPFSPAETSGYGNGPRAKIGYWASFERVFWTISKPSTALIGSETAERIGFGPSGIVPEFLTNSADTGFLLANGAWGNRWELGYIDDTNNGWMVSILDHISQAQYHSVGGAQVLFNDPGHILSGFLPFVDPVTGAVIDRDINNNNVFGRFGRDIGVVNPAPPPDRIFLGNPTQSAPVDTGDLVPITPNFTSLGLKNVTVINGTEVMHIYRAPRLHNGGYFELMYGVRWLQIDDTFFAFAVGGILDQTIWSARAQNNLIGPQLGGRWSNQRGRWITSFEARLFPAANFQAVHEKAQIGTFVQQNLIAQQGVAAGGTGGTLQPFPVNLTNSFGNTNSAFATRFSPAGEIRAQVSYQVTSAVALKIGYTGMAVGNITRASNRIDYSGVQLISILPGGTHQALFVNGINMGVEWNR
jgi:hypothetical protein